MKELVEYIARSIVDEPEAVRVTEAANEEGRIILTLVVADGDKGKVIGRGGRVAEAIRTVIRIAAIKQGVRSSLEIV